MTLTTSDDARRLIGLLREEYERLDAYLGTLSRDDWTAQSYCDDWKIYQVVSHLGSGPEVNGAAIRHALAGGQAMGDAERKAVWAHFDSLAPLEVLPAFRDSNQRFLGMLDQFDKRQLGAEVPWFGGGTAPLARMLASRLSETTLHAWDIRVVKDGSATLAESCRPDLLEFSLGRLDVLAKPELAWPLKGELIQFELADPDAVVSISLKENLPVGVLLGPLPNAGLRVSTATESFIRLLWGRYSEPAAPARLELNLPDLRPHLVALFPGR
jgi:uncharacterized protein (TIGR03083 family)